MTKKTIFLAAVIVSLLLNFSVCFAQSLRVKSIKSAPQEKEILTNETKQIDSTKMQNAQTTPLAVSETALQSAKTEQASEIKPTPEAAEQPKDAIQPIIAVASQPVVVANEHAAENNPLRKAARGAVNATLGWVEIPRQIIQSNKEKKNIGDRLLSPLKGLSLFVGRTAVGVYEITTFLIPPYKPVINPEFIFTDEENKK